MSRNPSSARAKSSQGRTETGFEKEYKEIRDLNSGTLKLLTEKQSEVEARTRLLEKRKLVDIHGNQAEMTSMRSEVVRARKLVMATGKYVTLDLKPTLTRLAETSGKYAALMQKKLNDEFDEYGSKKVNVEAFVSIVKEMQELRDFAHQLNSSIAEMDAEIYLAAVQILSAEKDVNAVMDVIQGRVRKEKEAQREREEEQRRLEEEKKRKKEEERRLKEEAVRRKKEEEEQRRRDEEELKKQRQEEEERRKIEEEEKRRIEEELERQREEEEERRRIEEDERRRQEEKLERQRKAEEELRRKMEEEARREEEKRMKIEEERRKREEEERRREEEEERNRRADPRNWTNVLAYDVESDGDALGHGIACVIRAPDDVTLEKHDLACDLLNPSINRYLLRENEELVSNIVSIRPSDQANDLQFPSLVWMAIPCSSASKTRETVIKLQQLRSESTATNEKIEWTEVPTRDTDIQKGMVKEHTRFVETELRHLSSHGINVVVVAKPKTDRQIITSKGGQLRSTIDQRIAVTVPKNAFKTPTQMTIQAIPVDSTVLKERYDGCDHLLGTSPVVLIRSQAGPQKPLTLAIPSPSGSGRRSRPKTSSNDRRASKGGQYQRPSTSMAFRDDDSGENDDKDFVSLVTRDVNGRWRSRDEISLDVQKESTVFEMSTLADRLLLLRTKELLQGSELVKIAQNLDQSLEDRLVSILVRQNPSDLNNLYVECCKREIAPKRIQSLLEDNLTQGPCSNQVLFKEGDLVEVSFAGNIHFEDKTPRLLTFHSNLASPRFFAGIKEVDGFSQNAIEHYRGSMRLRLVERSYKPSAKFLGSTETNRSRPTTATTDTGFICEFPIILPKPPKEVNRPKKIHLPLATQGPLTDEYLDHLSEELSEEWKMLATRLKFSPASVQRISADHGHLMSAEGRQRSARQMLGEWFRSSSKATDKAEKLQLALESIGRTDLAEELDILNRKYKEESERKQNAAHLMKCIKAYSDSQAAVNEWRSVGAALGIEEEDLETISRFQAEGIRGQAKMMLMKWIEVRGQKATKDSLIRCLKQMNLNEAVGKVKLVI